MNSDIIIEIPRIIIFLSVMEAIPVKKYVLETNKMSPHPHEFESLVRRYLDVKFHSQLQEK